MTQKNLAPVKIGVLGLGRFGRLHALTLARLAEAELVALVARRQASLDALSPELPGVPSWTSLQQALAESTAEAWVVARTTAAHVPVVRTLLEAGKTVLLEKPVADNLEEGMSLAPLVRPDSSNLMIGHIVLFNSEFQQLRVEAQQRGPLAYIDCVRYRPASILGAFPGENPLQFRADRSHNSIVPSSFVTASCLPSCESFTVTQRVEVGKAPRVRPVCAS